MADDEPTILIIGAGTFGTSTAYHLAKTYKDPSKVTVVDRAPSPPKPAASKCYVGYNPSGIHADMTRTIRY
jgi:glycine/D-amino acid oxidase-like deaminating enzyme